MHLRSLSDYCHLVNSQCNELHTISINEGPSPQLMYLTGDNKKMVRTSSHFSHRKILLSDTFSWCLSNLLLQAPQGILTGMVFPQINTCSCLGYTGMHLSFPSVTQNFPKHFASMLYVQSLNSWRKERKKPSIKRWG